MDGALEDIRARIVEAKQVDEDRHLDALIEAANYPASARLAAPRAAEELVKGIRAAGKPGRMDAVLAEYGLRNDEGIALLRLAEALIRVPDAATADALIADKIAHADWARHRGKSASAFVNILTQLLTAAAWCLRSSAGGSVGKAVGAVSRPIIRFGSRRAIELIAERFVLGRTMRQALSRSVGMERRGYQYSFDMLGEEALTAADAERFFADYQTAIKELAPKCAAPDHRDNHGISIKLSALHPRYELTKRESVIKELGARVSRLAHMAKEANIGIDIDAEEADRLELSLAVIEAVMRDPGLKGWDGFGIVVQAYGKAAPRVIDFLYALACELDRKIKIRLVKGAYWDSEIKRAQVEGLADFPVYTRKCATDVSYLCCAKKLLAMADRVYPQFAGHNAHTVSSILQIAGDDTEFEFQRMHGMGDALHDEIRRRKNARCRIYAPVGEYRELLPYLARRMLENGANTSFVNQIADLSNDPADISRDPFDLLDEARARNVHAISRPSAIFGDGRVNSKGWDLHNPRQLQEIEDSRAPFRTSAWTSEPAIAAEAESRGVRIRISNPSSPRDIVGEVEEASSEAVEAALGAARDWSATEPGERGNALRRVSDLYEENCAEIFSILAREAGKTASDAVAELREAVDFLRFYALEAESGDLGPPLGTVACISPWNFPLAIFTGQIAGALAAGNAVIAKPAEQTPLIAKFATHCFHRAGVPKDALQLLPGDGPGVGAALAAHPKIDGVAFTGSTETARLINAGIARASKPMAPLIAETGGINAMIVDSTAQPEQVVKDIVVSAFQSAGQRCSASRIVYFQEEISEYFLKMLFGAMDELTIGDPWNAETDIGPLIDEESRRRVDAHISTAEAEGRLMKQCGVPETGNFVGPTVLKVGGIEDLEKEIFGPVLHVATFKPSELNAVLDSINAMGYGLTFAMHSRIDARVEEATSRLKIGNMYINRNQIGAVVGSQPFGGEGLSGTGPKAGGPNYLRGFTRGEFPYRKAETSPEASVDEVQGLLDGLAGRASARTRMLEMPGPTGESNKLSYYPKGTVLCLGPSAEDAAEQARTARAGGCSALMVAPGAQRENAVSGFLPRSALRDLRNIDLVVLWSGTQDLSEARIALAARDGRLIPLVGSRDLAGKCFYERHVCIDTSAAGGNASLFAAAA